jgi:hypothetical protein
MSRTILMKDVRLHTKFFCWGTELEFIILLIVYLGLFTLLLIGGSRLQLVTN